MKLKIQAPEEGEKLSKVYWIFLSTSFLMTSLTLIVVTGFYFSK